MKDDKIIELFYARDENAIAETQKKYGALCLCIASEILALREDAEECVSDVMLALWNAIPPEKPEELRAYVCKAVRNRAREMKTLGSAAAGSRWSERSFFLSSKTEPILLRILRLAVRARS